MGTEKLCKHGCGREAAKNRHECLICRDARKVERQRAIDEGRLPPSARGVRGLRLDEPAEPASTGALRWLASTGPTGPSPIVLCDHATPPPPPDEIASALGVVRAVIGALSAKGCPAVELRVLDLAAERLALGLDRYGPMGGKDPRDLRREATEEAADGFVYALRALIGEVV